ncbi:hypothetical protein [Streptomyces albidus (ex Kaewkla and Franco 2022)]|uniref:hypothetical protein n=1 Tax=Streptomyces albidus (ex Kaewkla and Franco 2022) TaxID=722709 RepID=UPI0015EF565C|nr:hypothetical protein [Streptomyces albidus (ex Kaewkla and Franco 2022)]
MRHRRHTLRATVLLPCVAVALVTPLTSAASDPGARQRGGPDRISVTRPAVVDDLVPRPPLTTEESGGLPVQALIGATGVEVSVQIPARTGKSPISGGTSRTSLASAPAAGEAARRHVTAENSTGGTHASEHEHRKPGAKSRADNGSRERAGRSDTESSRPERRHRTPVSAHPADAASKPAGSVQPERSPSSVRPEQNGTPSGSPKPDRSQGESDAADDARRAGGDSAGTDVADETGVVFESDELYEPDPVEQYPRAGTGRGPAEAATGEVSPVLPLGAGLTSIGLGLALIALRLRRS